jgi:hypothetical protein
MSDEHEQRPPVLPYAQPQPWSKSARAVPIEPVAGEFMVGAWVAGLLLAPITLFVDGSPQLFCVFVAIAMFLSIVASGIMALALAVRWLLERRRLDIRGPGRAAAAGVIWIVGLLSLLAIFVATRSSGEDSFFAMLCWGVAEPIVASVAVVRRAEDLV